MKKALFFAFLIGFIQSAVFSQDIIYKTNGDSVVCKIKKEDSTMVYFEMKRNDLPIDSQINRSEISSIDYEVKNSKPEQGHFISRDVVLKLDLLVPAIAIEARMNDFNTFLFSYQPGFAVFKNNNEAARTYIVNQFRAATRFFYNIDKRQQRGRSTYKYSGNFLSISALYGLESSITNNYFLIGPTWGIQRNWGGAIHFSIEIGFGFVSSNGNAVMTTIGDLKLGFAL